MVRALALRVNASAVSRLAARARATVQADRTSVRRASRHPRLRQAELRHAREPDRLSEEERGLRGNEYGDIRRIADILFVSFVFPFGTSLELLLFRFSFDCKFKYPSPWGETFSRFSDHTWYLRNTEERLARAKNSVNDTTCGAPLQSLSTQYCRSTFLPLKAHCPVLVLSCAVWGSKQVRP